MQREEVLAIIEKIIEWHKVLYQESEALENVANDVQAMVGLEESKEAFMPGRFDQKEGLQKLQELLEAIKDGLHRHFHYEETALLTAFEEYGGKELASSLHSLLLEHEEIRQRLAQSKNHVTELTDGNLGRHTWDASAQDMRAYLSHTLKSLATHANNENRLLLTLREQFMHEGTEV
ncbi:hemerythrin domain-containing protein [Chloroflexota bacterium]